MSKAAITKHEIYNKLAGFSEKDLCDVVNFIDTIRNKKNLGGKRLVNFKGILKGHDIDLSALKELKQKTWEHVDQEFLNE